MHELYKKERSFALGAIVSLYTLHYLLISQPTRRLFLYSVIQLNIDTTWRTVQVGQEAHQEAPACLLSRPIRMP